MKAPQEQWNLRYTGLGGPGGIRPWWETAGRGGGAGNCPAAAELCAGGGCWRGDWQGGEEAQEISQWLYGQHWVSCSSPAARAAPASDRASPGPSRTPAGASQQRPSNKRRLEGLCPGGVLAERRGLLCRAEGVGLGEVKGCARGHPALHRKVPQYSPATLLLQGRAPGDCHWDQFVSQWPYWNPACWDVSRFSTFLWGTAASSASAGFPAVSWPLGAPTLWALG